MKKLPVLFMHEYAGGYRQTCINLVRLGYEWVTKGQGVATMKIDGSACAIIDGKFYRRYDTRGAKPHKDDIPCQTKDQALPDHFPVWRPCGHEQRADKWLWAAYDRAVRDNGGSLPDGTYEAIGLHFQSNKYGLSYDTLVPHGKVVLEDFPRNFDGMKQYLAEHNIEGVVFWKDGEPQCKLRKKDFQFKWPDPEKPVDCSFLNKPES